MVIFFEKRIRTLLLTGFLCAIVNSQFFCQSVNACSPSVMDDKYYGKISGFPSDEITTVISDEKGNIYVGTEDAGLIVIPAMSGTSEDHNVHKWTQVDIAKNLSVNAIHSLWIDKFKTLWIGTAGGLNHISIDSLFSVGEKFFASDGLKDNICLALVQKPDSSTMWIGTSRGLVEKGMGFKSYTLSDGLASDYIQSLGVDGQSNLWIGTSNGLVQLSQSGFENIALDKDNPQLSCWVNDIALYPFDSEVFINKLKITFNQMCDGIKDRCKQLAPDPEKNEEFYNVIKLFRDDFFDTCHNMPFVIATSNGLYAENNSRNGFFKAKDGWFTAAAVNLNGNGYAASKELNIGSLKNNTFEGYNLKNIIQNNLMKIVEEIKANQDLNQIIGSFTPEMQKLILGDKEEIELFMEKITLKNTVSSMCFSPLGQLWVAIKGGGLFRFRPIFVNHDSAVHAVMNYKQFSPATLTENLKPGLKLETPKVVYPDNPEIRTAIKYVATSLPEATDLWIGKWSELSDKDCEKVARFLGQWSFESCIFKLTKVLPENPYVVIPLGDY
ncbi:MAG: hypothetical protein HQM10_04505 [Candidatus Riflebacteria bacterium]|nr:hypothetical protein [Candidatus Riflebacteria bacterium]